MSPSSTPPKIVGQMGDHCIGVVGHIGLGEPGGDGDRRRLTRCSARRRRLPSGALGHSDRHVGLDRCWPIAKRQDCDRRGNERRAHRGASYTGGDAPAPSPAIASLPEPIERRLRSVEQRREPLEHVEPVTTHADFTTLSFICARARVVSERTEEAPMPSNSPASSAG